MVKPLALAGIVMLTAIGACGSSSAPSGALTECGNIRYVGSSLLRGETQAHDRALCFVSAVRACRAARLELDIMGVDTGTRDVLTVRRAPQHRCVTAVSDTWAVLGKTSKRHEICSTVTAESDGVSTSDCKPAG